jgi:hypothetical protein
MNEMTPWFPPHIKPVHKGVYEIKYTERGLHESYMWATSNGKKWSRGSHELADVFHTQFDANQDKYWRGFTKEQT